MEFRKKSLVSTSPKAIIKNKTKKAPKETKKGMFS